MWRAGISQSAPEIAYENALKTPDGLPVDGESPPWTPVMTPVVLNLRIHRHTAQRPTPPAWRTPSTHAPVIRVHD
jgi:hypothetical protein